jgi:hypothetical protein
MHRRHIHRSSIVLVDELLVAHEVVRYACAHRSLRLVSVCGIDGAWRE